MATSDHSPLTQFEVHTIAPLPHLFGHNIDFTNASLFMVLAALCSLMFFWGGISKGTLVPGRWQGMVEVYHEFIGNMVRESIGDKGRAFFPFIFTLFTFLLFANLLGMVPGGFTVTSHIVVTFGLAIAIFIGATAIGFIRHGLHFLHMFVPQGLPDNILAKLILMPAIILIELMSYLARPITLSLRLAGNMMAGHVLLKVVGGFVGPLIGGGALMAIGSIAPILLLIAFVGFEFLVAALQAYVFALLVCIYLNDAVNMH